MNTLHHLGTSCRRGTHVSAQTTGHASARMQECVLDPSSSESTTTLVPYETASACLLRVLKPADFKTKTN